MSCAKGSFKWVFDFLICKVEDSLRARRDLTHVGPSMSKLDVVMLWKDANAIRIYRMVSSEEWKVLGKVCVEESKRGLRIGPKDLEDEGLRGIYTSPITRTHMIGQDI